LAVLSYKCRIEPNRAQATAFGDMLADFCQLYNAGLEQRIAAYRRRRICVSYKMQADELKGVRCAAPELARWSFSAEQQELRRLDKTFKAFFARGKGFPRFRACVRAAGPDSVGVDFGLSNPIALCNRETVARPRWVTRAEGGLRRRQRQLARCKRTSKTRSRCKAALAKFQGRVAAKRRDHLHKVARDLVTRCGGTGIENLNIKGLAGGMLAKHVHDAAWSQLTAMLDHKAASAAVELVNVDPRGTSQTCPECGIVAATTLAKREHRCECGCALDRDVAAARVVHFRAFGFWPGAGRGSPSPRAAALA
jgi:IS605 OrfB family transposase